MHLDFMFAISVLNELNDILNCWNVGLFEMYLDVGSNSGFC